MNRDRGFRSNRNQQSNFNSMFSGGNGNNSYDDFDYGNNRGQRSGNRGGQSMNFRNNMSMMDDDEDFTTDTYGPGKSYGSMGSMGMSNKTPEQIAFDNEFQKWEQSFADWKLNNRNHTDPVQYRMYEQKFLDVRSKLLKKRSEIYGDSSSSRSGANPFDSQLNAADAMANSILSKFGSSSGNGGRNNNNNNNNNNGGRGQSGNRGGNNNYGGYNNNGGNSNNGGNGNFGGGNNNNRRNSNNGGGGSNDILNNELILTALKVITGGMGGNMGNMGGNMGNMGRNMGNMGNMGRNMGNMGGNMGGPMNNRGYGGGYNNGPYGSGYGSGYGQGYGRGNNNGPRRPGGDSRFGPRKVGAGRNEPAKKDDKKKNNKKKKPAGAKKEGEINSSTPFLDRIPIMFEQARNAECPKLLSGAAHRRLNALKDVEADKLNDKEKLFMEFAKYVSEKRDEYYKAHPKEKKEEKTSEAAEVKAAETKAEEAKTEEAKTEEAKVEDVEMKEDELLKD